MILQCGNCGKLMKVVLKGAPTEGLAKCPVCKHYTPVGKRSQVGEAKMLT